MCLIAGGILPHNILEPLNNGISQIYAHFELSTYHFSLECKILLRKKQNGIIKESSLNGHEMIAFFFSMSFLIVCSRFPLVFSYPSPSNDKKFDCSPRYYIYFYFQYILRCFKSLFEVNSLYLTKYVPRSSMAQGDPFSTFQPVPYDIYFQRTIIFLESLFFDAFRMASLSATNVQSIVEWSTIPPGFLIRAII